MSDERIYFGDFDVNDGLIQLMCSISSKDSENKQFALYFEMKPQIKPANDLIALALSTLCGTNFSSIKYDLPVSQYMLNRIKEFTKSDVTALLSDNENTDYLNVKKSGMVLSFSGGVDSLAAYSVMPKSTNLVSIDFGGGFSREEKFFKEFNPCTVKTNFRTHRLNVNTWTFMGTASILFYEYLKPEYNAFGTVIDSGAITMAKYSGPRKTGYEKVMPFIYLGMKDICYVRGLTEVGATMVASYFSPDLFNASLESCAGVGSEKRYRKQTLAEILNEHLNRNINFISRKMQTKPIPFGKKYTADFLTLYQIKYKGLQAAEKVICDIPKEIVKLAQELDLTFYERFNPNCLGEFTEDLRKDYVFKLLEAGVMPYTDKDWEEYIQVVKTFAHYYKELTKIDYNTIKG